MENITTTPISFWNFISKNKIEIPVIQRDYAQGRVGKEALRNSFLSDIKKSLDNPKEILKLDFVYGYKDGEQYVPLDGQQRLTTLWLVHWYLAIKSESLTDDVRKVISKFSYKTRVSSRDFIYNLASKRIQTNDDLEKGICNKTWFVKSWRQDPTVGSMIRMLDGSKDVNYECDSITKTFRNCTIEDYKRYWDIIISKECPILFYNLLLADVSLTDDLYVKMNARGKALTDFENLKADLIKLSKYIGYDQGVEHDNTFEHKMDTVWLDVFWIYRSPFFEVDDIYLKFIKRYFANAFVIAKKNDGSYLYSSEDIQKNRLLELLTKSTKDRITIEQLLAEEQVFNHQLLDAFGKTLDNFRNVLNIGNTEQCKEIIGKIDEINNLFSLQWSKRSSLFIPQYTEDRNRATIDAPQYIAESITIDQRVVFFAICRYFENGSFDERALKNWIRVVWNIVENSNKDYIALVRLVDLLAKGSNNILEHLASLMIDNTMYAKDQLAEEVEKAKKIINDTSGCWQKKIEVAENYSFFKGAIRCLYSNEKGEVDWDNYFDKKWENAQKYFSNDDKCFNSQYQSQFVTGLIKGITDWGCLYDKQLFNNNIPTWKSILLSDEYREQVHVCLIADSLDGINIEYFDKDKICENNIKNDLISSGIIDVLIIDFPNYRIKWNGQIALYEPYGRSAIVLDWIANGEEWEKRRNVILRVLVTAKNNELEIRNSIETKSRVLYFQGWEVDFKYGGVSLRWHSNGFIYLMNGDWGYQLNNNKYIRFDSSILTTTNTECKLGDFIKKNN